MANCRTSDLNSGVINAISEKNALYIFNTKSESSGLVGKVIIGGIVILSSLAGYGVVGGALDCSNRVPTFAGAIKYHSGLPRFH